MATTQQATPQLLYKFLRIGVSVLALVFVGLRSAGFAALMPADDFTRIVAYVMSGITGILLIVGVFVLKPRVPARKPGQSTAEYWSTPETVKQIMLVWFLIEGAGVFSAVSFLMTGHAAAGATMVLAIVVFWIVGPDTFEKA